MRKVLAIIMGVLLIIGGIYCIMTPGLTYLSLGWVIGFGMFLDGITRVITWGQLPKGDLSRGMILASGIISILFGTLLLGSTVLRFTMELFLLYLVAVWLVFSGIIRIVHAFKYKRFCKETGIKVSSGKWWAAILTGALVFIAGILSLFDPRVLGITIGFMIGIGILLVGCNLLTLALSWKDTEENGNA